MPDEAAGRETIYETGGGGTRQAKNLAGALSFALAAVAVGVVAFDKKTLLVWREDAPVSPFAVNVLMILGVLFVLVCLLAASFCLRERNNRVAADEAGLLVRDFLRREKFYRWDDIRAVIWRHRIGTVLGDGYTLSIHVDMGDHTRAVDIGYSHYEPAESLEELRDEIVKKKHLTEAHPMPPDFWARAANLLQHTETRIWK
ncbi:MAG: PH domain-containing protein [Armatimonadota bacterium]